MGQQHKWILFSKKIDKNKDSNQISLRQTLNFADKTQTNNFIILSLKLITTLLLPDSTSNSNCKKYFANFQTKSIYDSNRKLNSYCD